MRAVSSWVSRTSLALLLPLGGGCAAVHPGSAFVGATDNQVSVGAPRIRLIEQPPPADRVVDAAFRVDAEGFALVLAVDLDQQVHVVFPESPSEDGRVVAHETHPLAPFFAGSGRALHPGLFDAGYLRYRPWLFPYGPEVSRYAGAVYLVAVASGQPLQLDPLRDANGDWSAAALRSLLFDENPGFVGERLGRLVTGPGQEFTTDYRVIAGGQGSPLYASSNYRGCGLGAFGTDYGDDYFGAPTLGYGLFAPRARWLTTELGAPGPGFVVSRADGMCGSIFRGALVRRPAELFPRDTALVFTTRRIAMRQPGAGALGVPRFIPSEGASGSGTPNLSGGRAAVPRASEGSAKAPTAAPAAAPSAPAAAPRRESHTDGDRSRPAGSRPRLGRPR